LTATSTPAVGTITQIPIAEIRDNPRQVRRELTNIEELAASIANYGLMQAVLVFPADDGQGGYFLEAGHRRRAACALLGYETIKAEVIDPGSYARQIVGMLIENGQREDVPPMDEARAIQAVLDLRDRDLSTAAKLAKVIGRSANHVRGRAALTQLPAKAQLGVAAGQVTLEEASALLEFKDSPEALNELAEAVGTRNFQWQLRNAHSELLRARAMTKLRADLDKAGITVIDQPQDPTKSKAQRLSYLTDDKGVVLDEEEHQQCPHHAVFLALSGGEAVAVPLCLDPAAAGHRLRWPSTDGNGRARGDEQVRLTPQQEQRQREEEERDRARDQGRAMRAEFIQSIEVTQPSTLLAIMRLFLTHTVPDYLNQRAFAGSYLETTLQDLQLLAEVFNIDLPVAAQKSVGTRAQAERDVAAARDSWSLFGPAIADASLEQCVMALLSMLRRDMEYRVAHYHTDHMGERTLYLSFFRSLGYQFSDAELSEFRERMEDDDEDRCSNCKSPLGDGEGYDGLCGACADSASKATGTEGE